MTMVKSSKVISERNSGVELLRIVSMIMIIVSHIFSHQLNFSYNSHTPLFSLFIHTLFHSSIAVNCFMLISGYYGMHFKIEKSINLWLKAVLCGVFAFTVYLFYSSGESVLGYLGKFFPITRSGWWFFTAYMMVYLLSSFINAGIEHINKKQFKWMILCCVLFTSFVGVWGGYERGGGGFMLLFTAYILGRYLYLYDVSISRPVLYFFSLFLFLFMIIIALTYNGFDMICDRLLSHQSLFCLILSVLLFYTFKKMKWHSILINKLATSALVVYFLHESEGGMFFIKQILVRHDIMSSPLIIVLLAAFIYLICFTLDKFLISLIVNFMIKRIFNYYDWFKKLLANLDF